VELVPEDFEVPAGLERERFRLPMLSARDLVADLDAIHDRVEPDGTHRGAPDESRVLGRDA
jgi:hypothetical protein